MPVTPNVLERLLLLRLNRGPAPILDLFGAASFEAVSLALEVGLFDALDEGECSLGRLADRLNADERGIGALLAFLEAQGYVAESDGRYRNTRMTTTWLTDRAGTNLGPWFAFWNGLVFPFWEEHLATVVEAGEPPKTIYQWFDEEPSRWETAQRGFRAVASASVDEVTRAIRLPDGASSVLDVGGGHGLYAIELCRGHPGLAATVFDVPGALEAARNEIAAAGLGDRITVAGGDYWTDDLGTGYDLALVFNVVHAHDDVENQRLFARVGDALAPGGRIAILDQLSGSARMPVGRAGLAFVGLTYASTLGAETHPYERVAAWLREAGFEEVERTGIRKAGPGNTLVQARKADD